MSESTSTLVAEPRFGELLEGPVPAYKLFNAQSVTLATFFGNCIAGAILLAVNYRRLGEKGKATQAVILGLLATGLVVPIAYLAPKPVTTLIWFGLLIGMRAIATKAQGGAVALHVSRGGKLGSAWSAFGVGMVCLLVIFVAVFIPVYASSVKPKVMIGTKDEVYYTGSATKEDAQALGNSLKEKGYFKDRGTSVFLDKDKDGAILSLVVQDGAWDKPATMPMEEEVVREVAPVLGGFPVRFKLVNAAEDVKKQGVVGREAVGKDEVYYMGAATETEAKALGDELVKVGYLSGRGVTVLLARNDGGTAMSFVVGDGFADDPAHVAAFETIVRDAAPGVGGLPVTLRLVNSSLEVKKEVVVK